MPRMLSYAGIGVALLIAPALAFAAYDDVSLTTDTVLSVGGITLNVTGSTAAIESITVNASNFSVTLPVGSSFKVTAPGLEQFSADTRSGISSETCNASESSLGYAPTGTAVTVTIEPLSTLCSSSGSGTSASAPSSSPSSSSPSSTVTSTPSPSVPAATVTPTVPAAPAASETPAVPASGLSATQIQSILDVLASFDADAATIASVKTALEGTASTGSATSAAVRVFKSNLTVGTVGDEVKALQQFLNAHGYTIATSGPGSPGNETTMFGSLTKAAVGRYQKDKNITPAVGYFGPKTRAVMNADQ